MKTQISLKLYVSAIFLSLTAILVLGAALLSARYYMMGMDSIVASDMYKTAEAYLQKTEPEERKPLEYFLECFLTSNWENMPESIRSQMPQGPTGEARLMKQDKSGFLRPPEVLTFALRYQEGDSVVYVARQETRHSGNPLIGRNARENLRNLLLITLAAALVVGLIVRLLMLQVSRTVAGLGNWAQGLDEKTLQNQPPDFHYPELNALAELIRTSLQSVQEGLDREHKFLRHASHELRTPISVIRNNVELLDKLQHLPEERKAGKQKQVIQRIDRASLNMKYMTETLLWLSRNEDTMPSLKPVQLDTLITELTDDLLYLIEGKEVTSEVHTTPCIVHVPEPAAGIVISNLIRNALQHTNSGSVNITQDENHITIINTLPSSSKGDDLGFGLGLKLTEQLTRKLGWPYENKVTSSGNLATVTLIEPLIGTPN